jgi:hypothetical protein
MDDKSFVSAFGSYLEGLMGYERGISAGNSDHNWSSGSLPYDSGFLANSAFRLERTATGWRISIDTGMAPYADYINQAGYYTQGYWDALAMAIIKKISDDWGGSLTIGGNSDGSGN